MSPHLLDTVHYVVLVLSYFGGLLYPLRLLVITFGCLVRLLHLILLQVLAIKNELQGNLIEKPPPVVKHRGSIMTRLWKQVKMKTNAVES